MAVLTILFASLYLHADGDHSRRGRVILFHSTHEGCGGAMPGNLLNGVSGYDHSHRSTRPASGGLVQGMFRLP